MTAVLYTLAAVVLALVVITTTALHRAEARRVWRAPHRVRKAHTMTPSTDVIQRPRHSGRRHQRQAQGHQAGSGRMTRTLTLAAVAWLAVSVAALGALAEACRYVVLGEADA